MSFQRPRFTNAGRNLQLRSIGGTEIKFTKMKVGDGEIQSGMDYREFTDLISSKAELVLTGIQIDDGYAKIRGYFTNSGQSEGFDYRELGLFAQDPDDPTEEILYCYANYGEDYQYIADPTSEIIERSISVVAIVDDAENVTAVLDASAVYVDQAELQNAIETHNTDPTAHPDLARDPYAIKTVYVNSTSTEAEASRDGTQAHPYKYLKEALENNPANVANRLIIQGNSQYGIADVANGTEVSISGYSEITLANFTLQCCLSFDNCGAVALDTVLSRLSSNPNLTAEGATIPDNYLTVENADKLTVDTCGHLSGDTVIPDYFLLGRNLGFVRFYNCYLSKNGLCFAQCDHVKLTTDNQIRSNVPVGIELAESCCYDFSQNNAVTPVDLDGGSGSLYFDQDTIDSIPLIVPHLSATNNPHHVTFAQVIAEGGLVDVAHGGTGKTTLSSGGLLKGNGSGAVNTVSGVGALFALTAGSPIFGVLPVSAGGTGVSSAPAVVGSDPDSSSQSRGYVKLPCQTSGKALLVEWGECSTTDNEFTNDFLVGFADTNYSLVFSDQGYIFTEIEKNTDRFSIWRETSIGTRYTNWIAIGFTSI